MDDGGNRWLISTFLKTMTSLKNLVLICNFKAHNLVFCPLNMIGEICVFWWNMVVKPWTRIVKSNESLNWICCLPFLKTSSRHLDQDEYIRLSDMSSRHLQVIFMTSCKNVFNMSSRHIQPVFKIYCKDDIYICTYIHIYTYIYMYMCIYIYTYILWSEYKFSKSGLFGYTETKTVILKHYIKWLLLQIKIFLLKSGIRKDVVPRRHRT